MEFLHIYFYAYLDDLGQTPTCLAVLFSPPLTGLFYIPFLILPIYVTGG